MNVETWRKLKWRRREGEVEKSPSQELHDVVLLFGGFLEPDPLLLWGGGGGGS